MRFYNIFFSPTGGTEKVANIVAKGTKLGAEQIDLIKEPDKLMKVKFEKKDLCLVAVPSYGGRIPAVVTDMFCRHARRCRRSFHLCALPVGYLSQNKIPPGTRCCRRARR